jgi:anti-sigma factor RsiW
LRGLFDEKADMVLKCRDMAELVTPYLEGTLSRRARIAARLHLWLCAACRRYVAQMRRTIAFLGSGPRPAVSENERKIMQLLDDAQRRR